MCVENKWILVGEGKRGKKTSVIRIIIINNNNNICDAEINIAYKKHLLGSWLVGCKNFQEFHYVRVVKMHVVVYFMSIFFTNERKDLKKGAQ